MKKNKKILFLLLLIIVFSIGYAVLTSNLNINGIFSFKENVWDINVKNVIVDPNSVSSNTPVVNEANDQVTFSVNLKTPGDYYTFYFDLENNSTIDAMIDSVALNGIDTSNSVYVESSVTYSNGSAINTNDVLYKNHFSTICVSVKYKDITAEQIPENNISLNLSISISVKQSNSSAKLVAGTNSIEFISTGEQQSYKIPQNGVYRLEVWGGQGRTSPADSRRIGGYGGYSVGDVSLTTSNTLYIVVSALSNKGHIQIFGGGGSGDTPGGGATYITTSSGLLPTFESNRDEILIVAGGGGGNDTCIANLSGGGFKGNGTGAGTQEAVTNPTEFSGTFGQGANSFATSSNDQGGGGGGGYFGGAASSTFAGCGAGGSGYIGNSKLSNKVMYCYKCETSAVASTKTETTDNVSDSAISKYAKMGAGYARISLVSLN